MSAIIVKLLLLDATVFFFFCTHCEIATDEELLISVSILLRVTVSPVRRIREVNLIFHPTWKPSLFKNLTPES